MHAQGESVRRRYVFASSTRAMSFRWVLLGACMIAVCGGCGGSREAAVKRHAIQRVDEDEDAPPAAAPSAVPETQGSATGDGEAKHSRANVSNRHVVAENGMRLEDKTQEGSGNGSALSPKDHVDTHITRSDLHISESHSGNAKSTVNSSTEATHQREWSLREKIQRSAENLRKIGQALQKYYEDNGAFPAASINVAGRPLLSWRVALLPYLGEGELYRQFELDQPWNSRNNKKLLSSIPEVYRSLGGDPERTAYLAVVGVSYALRELHGRVESEFTDGLENTVMVVEVEPSQAVPWTEPRDYQPTQSNNGFCKTHDLGAIVLWASGDVGWIPRETPPHLLSAMLTLDSGEPFFAYDVEKELAEILKLVEDR